MTNLTGRQAMVEGLVLGPEGTGPPRLRGSRCRSCGECFFPARAICPCCSRIDQEAWEFGPAGKLYSYTILVDPPSLPPRAVGQVEFEGRVRVQGGIISDDFSCLSLDMPVELALRPAGSDEQGNERVGFGFQPGA